MANTSSARKMVRKIARRTARNRDFRSRMRNFIRRVEAAIVGGDKQSAQNLLREAQPLIARAGRTGLIHKRTAARKMSRLAKKVAALN